MKSGKFQKTPVYLTQEPVPATEIFKACYFNEKPRINICTWKYCSAHSPQFVPAPRYTASNDPHFSAPPAAIDGMLPLGRTLHRTLQTAARRHSHRRLPSPPAVAVTLPPPQHEALLPATFPASFTMPGSALFHNSSGNAVFLKIPGMLCFLMPKASLVLPTRFYSPTKSSPLNAAATSRRLSHEARRLRWCCLLVVYIIYRYYRITAQLILQIIIDVDINIKIWMWLINLHVLYLYRNMIFLILKYLGTLKSVFSAQRDI